MKYAKVRDVKSPCRGTSKSAGIDFFVPNYSEDFVDKLFNSSREDSEKIKELIELNKRFIKSINESGFILESLGRVFIPSGIKVCIDDGTALIAFNKSGIFTKSGLAVGACVIDSDYTGEICLSLFNISSDPIKICFGQKIIQFVHLNIENNNIIEIDSNLLFVSETERKEGGFGSTGI